MTLSQILGLRRILLARIRCFWDWIAAGILTERAHSRLCHVHVTLFHFKSFSWHRTEPTRWKQGE